ncbi:TolC family protein [Chryseobacterium indologenes]|uniref:TolC family protein n=1 Tax=Chryseobacterium indologenes TaxID=253 RepID=A0A5R9PW87_CHRID|nr:MULTISPECIES: TolC family protein [Chryseobacterium]ASE63309.1 TolC family protein [Chryseobacterium indologenes]ATN07288.1 TolC family protein [Chryseobacterium indologenes]AYY83964.1 TolC family protein [Chryseobacterium indologenes]AYZ37780.1 TolC family protein [Chryseobacterium indologenes]AZB19018.1 TolC family protein [Chryseobacterium indologenes]
MKKVWIIVFGLGCLGLNAQKKWSLKECVSYAVEHNLQVIQNQYNKQSQDANLKIARKGYLPSVSAGMNNGVSFGQLSLGTGSIRNDRFSNSASLGADMLVYNNGRLEKNVRKAQFDVEASQYDIETIKNDISLQIAQQYLTALLNKEIVKISQSAVENAQKQFDRAKITTQVGTTAQTVLAEAEAALAREKQNLKTAEVNVGRALFAIVQLLQLPDYKGFEIEDVLVPDTLETQLKSVDEVLTTAYDIQPQIKAAESRIKSAEAQTEVSKTAFWPTLTASAGLSTFYNNILNTNGGVSSSQIGFFQQYKDNFGQNVGLSLNVPIFNKGITKLQVEQSKINESLAKVTLEQQKQSVRQNVQKAQFDADANYETYLSAIETEKSTKLALDFADKSYAAGRTTIYDVNVARNNYANAQGSVAQAKYNYLFSLKLLNFYAGIPLSL